MENISKTLGATPSFKIKKEGVGTFLGVYLPTLLTMIGVCLYLDLGFILGHVGMTKTIFVLSFGLVMTMLTAFSISSTASNMKIGEGGTYYMISRSFGLEIGAATGISLYLAHTIMLSLCILGFSESIASFFPTTNPKILSFAVLGILTTLAYTSTDAALKSQIGIITLVLLSFFFLMKSSYPEITLPSLKSESLSFWFILGMIYPCLTGIEAGAAMSGDLKKPTRSITLGTIFASLTGFSFYLFILFFLGDKVPIDALKSDPTVLKTLLRNNPIALSGFWAATLSSALGCLLSAPRTLRAMSLDGLFPKQVGYPYGELAIPKVATILTASFASVLIYFGTIKAVVPILTMVLLIIYAILNLATAIEAIIGNPSWRPTFRISPYVSLFGACLCLFGMFMISSGQTFTALFLVLFIYFIVKQRGLGSKWDDLRQTILFSLARFTIYRLAYLKRSIRSWRPNFLVLSESGSMRSPLLLWANQMTQKQGFLTLASVVKSNSLEIDELEKWEKMIFDNLKKRKIEALIEMTIADNLGDGLKNIITNYGVGPLTPNTVILGECVRQDHFSSYIRLLNMAASAKRNVLVIRGDIETCLKKEIDIWWDDEERNNSEMAILLTELLHKSPLWRKAKIFLKSVVSSEKALELRKKHFEEFCKKSRLKATCQVYLIPSDDSPRSVVAKESTKRGIVFYSLSSPQEKEEKEYGNYYTTLMRDLKEIPAICFVMCKENIDIDAILS